MRGGRNFSLDATSHASETLGLREDGDVTNRYFVAIRAGQMRDVADTRDLIGRRGHQGGQLINGLMNRLAAWVEVACHCAASDASFQEYEYVLSGELGILAFQWL